MNYLSLLKTPIAVIIKHQFLIMTSNALKIFSLHASSLISWNHLSPLKLSSGNNCLPWVSKCWLYTSLIIYLYVLYHQTFPQKKRKELSCYKNVLQFSTTISLICTNDLLNSLIKTESTWPSIWHMLINVNKFVDWMYESHLK